MSTVPLESYRMGTPGAGGSEPLQGGDRPYHWRLERRGKVLSWFIDGQPFMRFEDPMPLTGKGHDRFGFSSWEARTRDPEGLLTCRRS